MSTMRLEDVVVGGVAVKPYPQGEFGVMYVREGEGAAAGEGDKGKVVPRTYTDEDLNRILAKERKSSDEKFDAFKGEVAPKLAKFDELSQSHKELKEFIDELRSNSPEPKGGELDPIEQMLQELEPPKGYTTKEARELFRQFKRRDILTGQEVSDLKEMLKKQAATLTALEAAKAQSDSDKEEAKLHVARADRSAKISAVLSSLPIAESATEVADAWLDRKVSRNKDTGRLMLVVSEDEIVPFTKENVDKILPASLRKSAVDAGGSGAGGGSRTPNAEGISALREQLAAAKAGADKATTPGERERLAGTVQRLKREIKKSDPNATFAD